MGNFVLLKQKLFVGSNHLPFWFCNFPTWKKPRGFRFTLSLCQNTTTKPIGLLTFSILVQFLLSFLHIFIRDFLTLFMHNNVVFWLSAQAKMIISLLLDSWMAAADWLHAESGGKNVELHLTFGRTKSSVQEVNGQQRATLHYTMFQNLKKMWNLVKLTATLFYFNSIF